MPKVKSRDGVFQRKDRAGWWLSYIDASGQRRKEKIRDAHTRTQALQALYEVRTRVGQDKRLGVTAQSEITTADLLARYKRHQKMRIRPTTYLRLGGILTTLQANLPAQAKAISKRIIADYVDTRSESVKPATVAKEMSVLKHCLKLAVEWELLHVNNAQGARLPKQAEGRTRYLTPGELRTALEVAPDWMRAPMALAACTGMRRGSLLGLRWMDVDLNQRRIYLRTTKTGILQVLPISDAALQVIASLRPGSKSDLLFAEVDAAKLSVYTRRVFHSIGIKDASFHTLRHTAASWLVQQGVDLYAVGQLLGHKTPRMTQRYAHLSPDYMAGAVGKLDRVMGEVLALKDNAEVFEDAKVGRERLAPDSKGAEDR